MSVALLAALIIGLCLGLLGSGGSILTIPVLIYILDRPEKLAVIESLAIVGIIAFIGSFPYALKGQVHWRSVLFFGLPGILGTSIGVWGSIYISGTVQFTLFSLVMITVAMMMLRDPKYSEDPQSSPSFWLMTLEGFMVGILTGLIGIGGGFLIVPALVLLSHLSMSFAVGTSLVIIALNCLIGFFNELVALKFLQLQVNWGIINLIAIVGIMGTFAGNFISKIISQKYLRKIFAVNILVMGTYFLWLNTSHYISH